MPAITSTAAEPPRRRGRPPKPRPALPWLAPIEKALKLAGADPSAASTDDVARVLGTHRHLHWSERAVVPIDPMAADVLGVSTAQLYRLARNGEIELVRSGGRTCATTSSITRYLEKIRRAGWTASDRHAAATAGRARKLAGGVDDDDDLFAA